MEENSFQRHRLVLRSTRGLKEKPWTRDELNVLALDFMDRHVVKIAGKRMKPNAQYLQSI